MRQLLDGLSDRLNDLGPLTFSRVTTVRDKGYAEATITVRDAVKGAGAAGALLLVFYFGHGLVGEEDGLHLYFRDSTLEDPETLVSFRELVAKWIKKFAVPESLLILDCCYAGLAALDLRILDDVKGKHFLMAATAPYDLARVDNLDSPLGYFSKAVLDAFTSPGAREPGLSRKVTIQSFFRYAASETLRRSKQEPESRDGGLGSQTFFEQATKSVEIPQAVRAACPKKSIYRKLYALSSHLLHGSYNSETALHSALRRRQVQEFQTPFKTAARTVEYRFVSANTFRGYVQLARMLGIVNASSPLALTPEGKRMVRNDGRYFNAGLYEALSKAWAGSGVTLGRLEDAIGSRVSSYQLPTAQSLWLDLYFGDDRATVDRNTFERLLFLTAYTAALQSTTERTFFPVLRANPALTRSGAEDVE